MLLTIITFLAVLGVLVLTHELGHFFAARRAGVKVEEFGFGFPPRVVGFHRHPSSGRWVISGRKTDRAPSTIYSINWIPLGGFVRIKGEQGEQESEKDSFGHQRIRRRIWIISAGVVMNVITAVLLLTLGFTIGLPQVIEDQLPFGAHVGDTKIQIVEVVKGLPAAQAGLAIGDAVVTVDGQTRNTRESIQKYFNEKNGLPITLEIERAGTRVVKSVVPQMLPEVGRAGIGIGLVRTGMVSYFLPIAFVRAIVTTYDLTREVIRAFWGIIVNLISRQPVGVELSGPVGIAVLSGEVVRLGFRYVLQFTALLSLNLAILNFLPFPALDGGRVVFLVIERFRGRAVSAKFEAMMHNIGFALLMLLVVFITYRDIARLVVHTAAP